jgi:hypothetical protein
MNRYQIAVNNNRTDQPVFHFSATGNPKKVLKYLNYCIAKRGIFLADNIPLGVIDTALVDLSRDSQIPIITKDESEAEILSITMSYYHVYPLSEIPEKIAGARVICCDFPASLLPKHLKPLLVILYGGSRNLPNRMKI